MTSPDSYVQDLLDEYQGLPGTSGRIGPADRRFARNLQRIGVPLDLVHAALLLATARRLRAAEENSPLPIVRSLAYFRHTIDELRSSPLDPGYLRHLESTVRRVTNNTARRPSQA